MFAEVEDRRQMLLDKMNVMQDKYKELKRALHTKINEVKLLRAEKAAMVRTWETDKIDALQDNADLLDKYKSRIFELENKLKDEMKKNSQVEEVRFDSDNFKWVEKFFFLNLLSSCNSLIETLTFSYAESLLATKRKELEEVHKKLEKQAIELLTREEANYDISKQLRYWRSKAMATEASIFTFLIRYFFLILRLHIKSLLLFRLNCWLWKRS